MSGRITEYKLLVSFSEDELSRTVGEMLGDGWKLYGTPFAKSVYYCQAMVKEEHTCRKG